MLQRNRDEVTWLHSYVSNDRRRLFCIHEAPTPEAIRKSATRNSLPVDSTLKHPPLAGPYRRLTVA